MRFRQAPATAVRAADGIPAAWDAWTAFRPLRRIIWNRPNARRIAVRPGPAAR